MQVQHFMYFTRLSTLESKVDNSESYPFLYQNLTFWTRLHHSNWGETLFSGTVRPRRLKPGTYVDSRQMYYVYRIQAAAVYLSLYFFICFLSN